MSSHAEIRRLSQLDLAKLAAAGEKIVMLTCYDASFAALSEAAGVDTLLIGDSLHDHEVAEALGVRCLLISQGHQSHARLAQCGAPVLHCLSDLHDWLTQ